MSSGDLRITINMLELCLYLYPGEEIAKKFIKKISSSANLINFKDNDEHNNLKSALQKSIRGSDVDADLHYFARLLAIGDHEALLRRMLITAYEDIGLANLIIIVHVKTAIDAFRQIGLPQGRIPLGLVIIEMCLSEKSNSAYLSTNKAYEEAYLESRKKLKNYQNSSNNFVNYNKYLLPPKKCKLEKKFYHQQ